MKKALLIMAAAAALLPAACAPTATATRPVDLSFAQMAPLELNVGAVQVVDQAAPGPKGARVLPAQALETYAARRLKAAGGEGTLHFIIQQASLTSAESPPAGNWTDAFRLSSPMEYTVTMRVGLDLDGRASQPNIRSAYTLERKKTLPAGTSLAGRDYELNTLIESMVHDIDQAVQTGLSQNMKVLLSPGPLTFGNPAPLEPEVVPAPVGPAAAPPAPLAAVPRAPLTGIPQD
jgi:hypothetical protein